MPVLPLRPLRPLDSASRKRSGSAPSPLTEQSQPLHTTVFRSSKMMVLVESPSVQKVLHESNLMRTLPVFGDYDRPGGKAVSGKVMLESSCSPYGRLSIQIEGAFKYVCPQPDSPTAPFGGRKPGNHGHVFFSSSVTIPVSPTSENSPRSAIREAFSATRRRPSASSLLSDSDQASRSFPFSFELPRGSTEGKELPPTFSSTKLLETSPRGRAFVETAEIKYSVTATWTPTDASEGEVTLGAPFLFQPDTDFQSLDGRMVQSRTWLEFPLRSDRPISFHCAITLQSPSTFNRGTPIPYFVVFTTSSKSATLIREIASDATVSVSLVRQVIVPSGRPLPLAPPSPPAVSTEEISIQPRQRFMSMRRVVRSAPPILMRSRSGDVRLQASKDKALPDLPLSPELPPLSETRTLQTNMSIGFPKRPRHRSNSESHPPLEAQTSLPDGLIKGHVQLDKDMLPCINWAGISVKYYLDVSVLFEQDNLGTRIPINIV